MPISDYYEALTKRTYASVWNGTDFVDTPVDTTIYGYVVDLSAYELTKRQQMNLGASASLYADETLLVTDRIVWREREYEIVYKYDSQFNIYYDLRKV
jgi:hypothetical protein